MRVTIQHREEVAGLVGDKRQYYVDCTVVFSEEEKAIIRVRGLNDHFIVAEAPTPPPAMFLYMAAGVMMAFTPLFVLIGIGLTIASVFYGWGYGLLGTIL